MKKIQVLLLWVAVSMMPWMALARTDAFYEQRLKAGKDALAARRGAEAIEELRIAVFGFIDEPRPLAESLAYLVVAQNGVGRTSDVEATLTRFVDSEKRAAGYDRRSLPDEVRVQFESLLTKQFSRSALAAVPSLAPMVNAAAPRTAQPSAVSPVVPPAAATQPAPTPKSETRTAPSQPIPTSPQPAASSPARTIPDDQRSGTPNQTPPEVVQQTPPRAASTDIRPAPPVQSAQPPPAGDPADQARQMIAARRAGQAVGVITAALESEPQRRELRLLLLQAAAMTSDWKQAVSQISLLRPFNDNEPVFMFYAAVTMWESSRPAEARELLDRALPRLNRTPYVETYVKKILPERGPS